jgi:hypothetical protein
MILELLENIILIVATATCAFLLILPVWIYRGHGKFGEWWEAEGLPIFMIIWIFGSLIGDGAGCFHFHSL